ncbi:MAG: inorganic phosphate transporter [Bacillus sp. (in: firmicutes)]
MNVILTITILIVIFALVFDFINGFHDTANSIATAVSTNALKPRQAIILASIMNFIGAMTFTGVAKTISSDIVDPFTLPNGSVVILAALLAAITWNIITWYYGIPSSSSHAIIGAIAGASVVAAGVEALNLNGFINILKALFYSPIIAFIFGYLLFSLFKLIFQDLNLSKSNQKFRIVQIFTAAAQAYAHGMNDAQKTMGIITMALIAYGAQTTYEIPFWVQLTCAIAMGLGTSVGGWRIITTVASNIMKIRPINGVAADISGAFIIFGASFLHIPISTTYIISSSIMGVGASQGLRGVRWGTVQRMVLTWAITLPISALLAGLYFSILSIFF